MLTRIGDLGQSRRLTTVILETQTRNRADQQAVASGKAATSYAQIAGSTGALLRAKDSRQLKAAFVDRNEQLAARLEHWRQQGRDLAFLIGGPEGHAPEVIAAANESWSLGPLTLPHMLVRLVLAEQLYRAASLLANHPYHRA